MNEEEVIMEIRLKMQEVEYNGGIDAHTKSFTICKLAELIEIIKGDKK